MIEPLIERSPQIAMLVVAKRPFDDVAALAQAIESAVLGLDNSARLAFFQAHPELAPDHPLAMTTESQAEQGRLNLTSVHPSVAERLKKLNRSYRDKFGFPFITAVVRHDTIESMLNELEQRMTAEPNVEVETALGQIVIITRARVAKLFGTSHALKANTDG